VWNLGEPAGETRLLVVALIGWERTPRLQSLLDAALGAGIRLQPLRISDSPWQQLRHTPLDGILLERNLGDEAVRQICESARLLPRPPVIVAITSMDDDEMRAVLDAGADAVLPVSAGVGVVAAQLSALLRRQHDRTQLPATQFHVGGLTLDVRARRATAGGRDVPLTNLEFGILVTLARNMDQVLSSSRIYFESSGIVMLESEARELMKAHVRRIRAKLQVYGISRDLIKNVRGEGYMIERRWSRDADTSPRPAPRRLQQTAV
jgi:DNA-binding response OmpR family regulator